MSFRNSYSRRLSILRQAEKAYKYDSCSNVAEPSYFSDLCAVCSVFPTVFIYGGLPTGVFLRTKSQEGTYLLIVIAVIFPENTTV